MASVVVWVKAGYLNEPDSVVGISHVLEHMFFKGTPNRPVGAIQDEVKSYGGLWNAGTIYDYTTYYIVVPAGKIAQAIEIQADALINSTFPADELAKEQEVIFQEILRKHDNPGSLVFEWLMELSFDVHRLRRWRMGTAEEVQSLSRQQLIDYYTDLYRPENIIVAVAGDVDVDLVFKSVSELFGVMDRGKLKKELSPVEPAQTKGFRYEKRTGDINQTYMGLAYRVPGLLHQDHAPLEMLGDVLGDGRSSRLYQNVKEQRSLVNTIGAGQFALADVGVFIVEAELEAANVPDAQSAIADVLVLGDAISRSELDKAKTRAEAAFIFSQESVGDHASLLCRYESYGDWQMAKEYLENLRSVTLDDVHRVARKYLTLEQAAMIEYRPDGDDNNQGDGVAEVEARMTRPPGRSFSATEEPARPDVKTGLVEVKVDSAGGAEIECRTLSNGIPLLVLPRHHLPIVSVALAYPGGRIQETVETGGLTGLTVKTALKGTSSRTALEIQEQIESLGTGIERWAGPDEVGFGMTVLSSLLDDAIPILSDVLLNPVFPLEEVEQERRTTLAMIASSRDDMHSYPIRLAFGAAHRGHPYELPRMGREDSVGSLTQQQLIKHHHLHIAEAMPTITVVGDIDVEQACQVLDRWLGAHPVRKTHLPQLPQAVGDTTPEVEHRRKAQTAMALALPGMSVTDPYYHALQVLKNIAGGMGGRLYKTVREEHHLAYTVQALIDSRRFGGAVVTYVATSPENEGPARDLILDVWEELAQNGPSDEELQRAIQYTVGACEIGLQSSWQQANLYLASELSGLGPDFVTGFLQRVRDVSIDDVLGVASGVVDRNRLAQGIVRGEIASSKRDEQ